MTVERQLGLRLMVQEPSTLTTEAAQHTELVIELPPGNLAHEPLHTDFSNRTVSALDPRLLRTAEVAIPGEAPKHLLTNPRPRLPTIPLLVTVVGIMPRRLEISPCQHQLPQQQLHPLTHLLRATSPTLLLPLAPVSGPLPRQQPCRRAHRRLRTTTPTRLQPLEGTRKPLLRTGRTMDRDMLTKLGFLPGTIKQA